ncbi:MAG TPA: LysR family transcriptional regulator [Stellaceae bacterium]|jgi:DNA-binding transcriptional LysR family regulator
MLKRIEWETRIGRQPSLRDLHVFICVAQSGSMGKAARQLRLSQPTVSEAIADLEYLFGVKLFDRGARGVEITPYGAAFLRRSVAVFDELLQTKRDIEFLANSSTGELRIGASESNAATFLPEVIREFFERYPGVTLHVDDVPPPASGSSVLRDRSCDLILTRPRDHIVEDDLNVEILFEDEMMVAAGPNSRWIRRRKIALAELIDEPWILTGPSTWNHARITEAFLAQGLAMPKIALVTGSVHLRTHLLANSSFIAAFPRSVLRSDGDRFLLKPLPVDLPHRPWPVAIVTLKNRTLSPVVARFIECAREVAKSFASA